MNHRCCISLMRITYSFTDKIDGTTHHSADLDFVQKWAKLSSGVTGWGVCTRCGYEPEELEWPTADDFLSHADNARDPL